MEIGKSFGFVFEDRKWPVKLLLAALISIVPILNFAWYGYLVQLLRNVYDGLDFPLPDWDDLGKKFVEGLILTVVTLIYSLPIIIVYGMLSGGIALTEAITGSNSADAIYAVYSGLSLLVSCLVILYSVAIGFFFPAMVMYFSRRGTFSSCFRIGKIFGIIKENAGDYLIAWLVSLVTWVGVSLVAGFVIPFLVVTCCLIPVAVIVGFFVSIWPMLVSAHLFGQVGMQPFQAGELESIESE